MENFQKLLARLPILAVGLLYCCYLAYDHYDWMNSSASELGMKKASVVSAKTEFETMKKKLSSGEDFFKNLDAIRERIKALTLQLDSTKTSLSGDIDIANFVRIITLEVNKLNFQIKGIKPEQEKKLDYYVEVPFIVNLKGAYVQILVFFDRVSKFQQVIRISDFSLKPTGNPSSKFVELDATVKLVSYKYLGSSADDIVKSDRMNGKEREQWSK
ncbi:MAG: type 4a pilus biogenesis protein PilO [Deltaproteobacteria bacterium]|nr:type 4a pilus biogenesis protein PilO [Deltaproteobacteria bacterium]